MLRIIPTALLTLAITACATSAASERPAIDLAAAIDANDVAVLNQAAERGPLAEANLANGILAGLRREDAEALSALSRATRARQLSGELRRDAWYAMSGIYLRQSRFAEAVAAMDAADAAAPADDEAEAASVEQARVFASALADVGPMQVSIAPGETPITRDMARLPRTPIQINGGGENAIVDTGAAYSTISQSVAERLGLRFLDADVTVGSSTHDAVASRLAIAERVQIANSEFRNVVFIVLPDSALSFANGAYTIQAIIGFPLLIELGRIEFMQNGEAELMRYAPSPYAHGPNSNLLLDGLQPHIAVRANDAPLVLVLDTGAQRSSLTESAAREFPALVAGANIRTATVGGAGGMVTRDVQSIPRLSLQVGPTSATLENVEVAPDQEGRGHGLLGQDVMRSGAGYVIDFDAMRLEILPVR